MSARAAMHSSERHDWCTPPWFLRLVRQVAPIAYDPATTEENPTGAAAWSFPNGSRDALGVVYLEEGLGSEWMPMAEAPGLVFCNPPYGRDLANLWMPKMYEYEGEALYLTPNRPETAWHRALVEWSQVHLAWSSDVYGSRIAFVLPDGTKPPGGPAFPSSVFYSTGDVGVRTARERLRAFRDAFGPHGRLTEASR